MGGQGGCERRIEVFVKIQKKLGVGGRGVGSGGDVLWRGGSGLVVGGGQGVCERKIEVFVKNKKKIGGRGGRGEGLGRGRVGGGGGD